MLGAPDVRESIWVTFRFGFWTITIEMALGIALALMLEKPIRGASVFRTIFILPLMISPVVVGLVWRYLFDAQLPGYASAISVLLIVIVFALSADILIIGNPMKEQSDV